MGQPGHDPGRLPLRGRSEADLLDSWKAVAAYLGRDVRTAQRWEKAEGLPVHRHGHRKLGSVYAFKPEIDAWKKARRPPLERGLAPEASGFRRDLSWLLAGVFALVAGAAVASWWLSSRAVREELVLARVTSDKGVTFQPALSPDGKLLAYASDRGEKGDLNIWVQQLPHGRAVQLTSHAAHDYEPSFSPEGSEIVFGSDRDGGGIYVVPAAGGDRKLLVQGLRLRRPRFSPDGRWIVYSHLHGDAFLIPAGGGQPRRFLGEDSIVYSPVWTPDGAGLLFYGFPDNQRQDWDWHVASLAGDRIVKTGAAEVFERRGLLSVENSGGFILPEVWIAGTNQVVFTARLGDSVNLWRVRISPKRWKVLGRPERITAGTGAELQGSASVMGRLAFSSVVRNLDIWSLPVEANRAKVTGELRHLTHDPADDFNPTVSTDGKKMAFEFSRTGKRLVWAQDLETGEETLLSSAPSVEDYPAISVDGSKVVYGIAGRSPGEHSSAHVVPFAGGSPELVCNACAPPFSWSSDGNWLLYRGPPGAVGKVSVLRMDSREQFVLLQHPQHRLFNPRFSPGDGEIAFHAVIHAGPVERTRVFVVPFRYPMRPDRAAEAGCAAPPESDWIPVAEGSMPQWSPDGNLIYLLSARDGFLCIWAQRLNPTTKRPTGSPVPVYHSHAANRSFSNVDPVDYAAMSVARDKILFTQAEMAANIWMAERQERH